MNDNSVIDLGDVLISPATHAAWLGFAERVTQALGALGVTDPSQIPDEQGRINSDGSLKIFVTLPNGEVSKTVPKEYWGYRQMQ
ncbi:MAG: hypothetical protein IPJ68_05855 [Candidatus Moraniibacteriota bacterium]|nr:MAG: hypothetical protein IPJ68_05855 [Candidatus Moranbacteria bacterium]